MSDVQVEAYSGAHYAERPRAFTLAGERHVVVDILDQWRLPDSVGFRVRTESGLIFELVYREAEQQWHGYALDA